MKKKVVRLGVIGLLVIGSAIATFTLWKRHQQELTTIAIARDGSLSRAGQPLDAAQLGATLQELAAKGQRVTIRADAKTDYSRVAEIVNACSAANVPTIRLATASVR